MPTFTLRKVEVIQAKQEVDELVIAVSVNWAYLKR
jgi:hypothetical protein